MTTWIRNLSVLGVAVFLAVASTGCDDDDTHGVPNSTTTTSTSTTSTTNSTVTSTTNTTATTVTTVTSTTSTTIGGGGQCACELTFSVTNVETLGALQYDTSYAGVGGGFDGTAGAVDCTRLAGDFAAFNDIEAQTKLSSAFISAAGFTGPIDVARCRYTRPGTTEPVAADFPITITDQSKPDFSPANATVEVTNIGCVCSGGNTTTTLGGGTTTTTTGGGTTTTTTGGGGTLYNVAFDLADAVTAGALQFEVNYSRGGRSVHRQRCGGVLHVSAVGGRCVRVVQRRGRVHPAELRGGGDRRLYRPDDGGELRVRRSGGSDRRGLRDHRRGRERSGPVADHSAAQRDGFGNHSEVNAA